jgi:DNA polymerase-3 subunit alpha
MKRVKPNRFADIVALVALFRPGPLQLADDFIRRKHGLDEVDYLHPSLKEVLQDTYGVMLYQEQVMQIAQILAGYSLADADLLRRAMGKKKPEEMAKQRQAFVDGAMNNDVSEQQAGYIFDLMEKFAGYGFNKPHSVCYALVAYQTAWLKHYYPADFMAAVMSADMQNTDKIVINVEECREMGLVLDPPSVNSGAFRFVAQSKTHLVYGLGAIKGLGEGPIEALTQARCAEAFKDLYDFCHRVDVKRLNRRALDALIHAGALDHLAPDAASVKDGIDGSRGWLLQHQEEALRIAEQTARNQEAGHTDLFGELEPVSADPVCIDHIDAGNVLTMATRLAREKEALGLYLTGHPIDIYRDELKYFASTRISDLRASQSEQLFAGWVIGLRSMKTQRGTIVFVTLDDRTARIEVGVFSDLLEVTRDKISKDNLLVIRGSVAQDDFSGGLRVRATEIFSLVEARQRALRGLTVRVHHAGLDDQFSKNLAGLLSLHQEPKRTGCPVIIDYRTNGATAELQLGDQWRVKPSDELLDGLRAQFGSDRVGLDYHPHSGGG